MQTTFTIEETRNYLNTQDSFGDIFYNLSEENIIKANESNDVEGTHDLNEW